MPHTPSRLRATTRKPDTAPPRIATWTASTRLRRAAAAVRTFDLTLMYMPMMPAGHRAGGADEEGEGGHDRDRQAGEAGHVGDVRRLDEVDDDADDDRADNRKNANRGVLAPNESDGTLIDRARHIAHRVGAGVAAQDVACQITGKGNGDDAGNGDDPLDRGWRDPRFEEPPLGLICGVGRGRDGIGRPRFGSEVDFGSSVGTIGRGAEGRGSVAEEAAASWRR